MSAIADCTCNVCMTHRLYPHLPEHVQEVQLRQEHAALMRSRQRARVMGWALAIGLLAILAIEVFRALPS